MPESPFEEMKRYVNFTEEDSRSLAAFRPLALPHLGWVVDRFYARIMKHSVARSVLSGPDQVERLKKALAEWADRLFAGPHDEAYYQLRCRIGRAHVKVGLRQMYMFTAMSVIRESFRQIVFRELANDPERKAHVISSLHKLLDMDLAIMLETYREDYIAKIHRSEQQASIKRLAAIGEVAASVAHEVRNPLAGISGAVEILRDDLPEDSPRREVVREVLSAIRRLDERVRDLLIYARTVGPTIERVSPGDLIRSTLALLSEEPLMRDIKVHVSAPFEVGEHPMDRGQMQEVLVNLIRNAADAMQGRGELFIEAQRRDGGALAVTVEDTGPGVSEDRREEIFRPFVTTRPQGTGLGLAISRRTLDAHSGSLVCERGSRGARFVALLPPDVDGR
jgi:signal transduction histidine kinase